MTAPEQDTRAEQVKACCATAYSSDLVGMLLGDSYHPGGLALSRTLAGALGLGGGDHVLDVASGAGTTALMLAREYDVTVDGVDLSPDNVAVANEAAVARGLAGPVHFRSGDAERLPFADATFDAAVCECAFCTFPDKDTAAAELARVLRPGGRLGITDVVLERDRLPPELTTLGAWVACIADARPAEEYAEILAAAGLRVTHVERHDTATLRMVEQVRARIELLRMTSRAQVEALGLDFDQARPLLDAVESAARTGTVGYALLVAERPR